MDSPQPTLEEFEELKAEVAELRERVSALESAELREQVAALEGALNALVVVWAVRRLPPPGGQQ